MKSEILQVECGTVFFQYDKKSKMLEIAVRGLGSDHGNLDAQHTSEKMIGWNSRPNGLCDSYGKATGIHVDRLKNTAGLIAILNTVIANLEEAEARKKEAG